MNNSTYNVLEISRFCKKHICLLKQMLRGYLRASMFNEKLPSAN